MSRASFASGIHEVFDTPYFLARNNQNVQVEEVEKNIWRILNPHTPMFAHEFFLLDEEKFIQTYKGRDFLEAKRNSYESLKYSKKNKSYLFKSPVLKDWAGLNHPPVLDLVKGPEYYYKTEESVVDNFTANFHYNVDKISDSELSVGNEVKYYKNKQVFSALYETLEKAKEEIWGSSLLVTCDDASLELRNILKKKAREGVKVYLILDKTLQKIQNGSCEKELQKDNIKVLLIPGLILKGSGFHFKNWVVDRKESIMMGANVVDSQILSDGFNYLYHDSGVWLKGPSVLDMTIAQLYFWKKYSDTGFYQSVQDEIEEMKREQRKSGLRGSEFYSDWDNDKKASCRVVWQSPNQNKYFVSKVLAEYFKNASTNIITTNVGLQKLQKKKQWHNKLIDIVKEKAREGVKVDIITNFQHHAFSPYYAENSGLVPDEKINLINWILLQRYKILAGQSVKNGIGIQTEFAENDDLRLWSYISYNHNKTISIDKHVSVFGSFNTLSPRSNKDTEITLICHDKNLGEELHKSYVHDLVNSYPIPTKHQVTK